MACEKDRRICRGVEVDPLSIDVIVRRFEAATGIPALLAETGERFADVAVRRLREPDVTPVGVAGGDLADGNVNEGLAVKFASARFH